MWYIQYPFRLALLPHSRRKHRFPPRWTKQRPPLCDTLFMHFGAPQRRTFLAISGEPLLWTLQNPPLWAADLHFACLHRFPPPWTANFSHLWVRHLLVSGSSAGRSILWYCGAPSLTASDERDTKVEKGGSNLARMKLVTGYNPHPRGYSSIRKVVVMGEAVQIGMCCRSYRIDAVSYSYTISKA